MIPKIQSFCINTKNPRNAPRQPITVLHLSHVTCAHARNFSSNSHAASFSTTIMSFSSYCNNIRITSRTHSHIAIDRQNIKTFHSLHQRLRMYQQRATRIWSSQVFSIISSKKILDRVTHRNVAIPSIAPKHTKKNKPYISKVFIFLIRCAVSRIVRNTCRSNLSIYRARIVCWLT